MPQATSLLGWCGAYSLFGWKTCPPEKLTLAPLGAAAIASGLANGLPRWQLFFPPIPGKREAKSRSCKKLAAAASPEKCALSRLKA
ncbi:YgaP family membrane protein [Polaromonas sp. CG_9.5]|uniref:YgaP family membrane protein n=1 Tax=Polaromonas sp. CG_9.5 TaxID=3071705 RepID=UPI002E0F259C